MALRCDATVPCCWPRECLGLLLAGSVMESRARPLKALPPLGCVSLGAASSSGPSSRGARPSSDAWRFLRSSGDTMIRGCSASQDTRRFDRGCRRAGVRRLLPGMGVWPEGVVVWLSEAGVWPEVPAVGLDVLAMGVRWRGRIAGGGLGWGVLVLR